MANNLQKIMNNLLFVWNNFFVSKYFNRFFDDYFWNLSEDVTRKYIFDDEYSDWEITHEDKWVYLENETKKFLSMQKFLLNRIPDLSEKSELNIYFDLKWIGYLLWFLDFFELYINSIELRWIWKNNLNIKFHTKEKEYKSIVKYWESKMYWEVFKEINFLENWWYPKSRISIEIIDKAEKYDLWLIDHNINPQSDKDTLSKVEDIYIIDTKDIQWNSTVVTKDHWTIFVKNPTRSNLRYFMYRYFWEKDKNWSKFDRFSEERQDSVNLLEIFDEDLKKEHTKSVNWHIEERGWQFEILSSILKGNNTLWIMSTWGWKSLMYQLSSILLSWTAIVVSPLKSLMEDQYANMKNFGLETIVARIHWWLSKESKEKELLKMKSWNLKLLYVAPERFQIEADVNEILDNYIDDISIFTVDEAHCLSEWGHDFRFSYLNLWFFVESIRTSDRKIPVLALTATASPMAKNDIINFLWIERYIEESSINRTNISMEIIPVNSREDKRNVLLEYMRGKMDKILRNVAEKEKRDYRSIFEQNEEWKFSRWWLVFTIYWPIKSKTAKAAISSTAFDIYRFLVNKIPEHKDDFMFYFSEIPDSLTYEVCPECGSWDIVYNASKKYILYCGECEKFTFYLPKDRDWNWRKACCWGLFTKSDVKYNWVGWWCNECKNTFHRSQQNEIQNVYISKEFSESVNSKDIYIKDSLKKLWDWQRMSIQDAFKNNDLSTLVSTKWFWMWIDKPNISFVIHYVLSSSLEQYYQEIWRAWRNKEHAHSVILFAWPCDECMEDTNNFSNMQMPECIKSEECLKYKKCPYDSSPMCDLARQLCMIKNPLMIDNKFWVPEFIDTKLIDYKWERWEIKDFLMNNVTSWFSSDLTEFWQTFLFYKDNIEWESWTIEVSATGDFDEEKLIYRLLCMWIVKKYYKNYKSWKFKIFLTWVENSKLKDIVLNFLLDKVWEINWDILDNHDEQILRNATWSNKDLYLFAEALYMLLKKIYKDVEYWRLQQLIHLYNSIQLSDQWDDLSECFRWQILRRLLWTTEANLWKCWFCSWCNKDSEHYDVVRWNLITDKKLKSINSIFKRKLRWEEISEDDEKKLKEYTKKDIWMIRFRDKLSDFLSSVWSDSSVNDMLDILKSTEKNNLNISWDVEKVLDSGRSWLNALLIDACLKIETRKDLAEQNIKRIVDNYMSSDNISILDSILQSYWENKNLDIVIDTMYNDITEKVGEIDDKNMRKEVNNMRDNYLLKKLWNENFNKYKHVLKLFNSYKK